MKLDRADVASLAVGLPAAVVANFSHGTTSTVAFTVFGLVVLAWCIHCFVWLRQTRREMEANYAEFQRAIERIRDSSSPGADTQGGDS